MDFFKMKVGFSEESVLFPKQQFAEIESDSWSLFE